LIPVTFPDTLYIGCNINNVANDRFVINHIMISEKQQKVAATAQTTIVAFDYDTNKKCTFSDEQLRNLKEFSQKFQIPPKQSKL